MGLDDPHTQATYSRRSVRTRLFEGYAGPLLLVGFGLLGAIYAVGLLLDLQVLVGRRGDGPDASPQGWAVFLVSIGMLAAGSVWGAFLFRRDWAIATKARDLALTRVPPARDETVTSEPVASAPSPGALHGQAARIVEGRAAWTGWIPLSYVATGEPFAALVPAAVIGTDGQRRHLVGSPHGPRVWIDVRCSDASATAVVHEAATVGGGAVRLLFKVLPPGIGGLDLRRRGSATLRVPPQDSNHDPVEDAVARFLAEPAIEAALASFDLAAYRRTLDRHLRVATGPVEAAALARLRLTRRFFAAACGTEAMGTLWSYWGCGFRLIGERDRLGATHVATRWITLAFLPVWPLRSFVVFEVGPQEYDVLAEVPTDTRHRLVALWLPAAALAVLMLRALSSG